MRKISTGQPATLRTYREIAFIMSGFTNDSKAVKFFDDRIKEQGPDELVIQDESQVLFLIASLIDQE